MIALLVVLLAAALGTLSAPRYRPPADNGETRLRQRAAQFYRAQRLLDFATMGQLYSPAEQLDKRLELRKLAVERAQMKRSFDKDTLEGLQKSADTVDAAKLTVQLDGDWAVTGGEYSVHTEGQVVPAKLDDLVWVRTGGDWWLYQLSNAELNAYGNPPDFARKLVAKREFNPEASTVPLSNNTAPPTGSSEPGGTTPPSSATPPTGGSSPPAAGGAGETKGPGDG
jgi:hypothetical protein